jgi:hypothetical protein
VRNAPSLNLPSASRNAAAAGAQLPLWERSLVYSRGA